MASVNLSIGYPIDFSAYGDRTFEAISKGCINEIAKIYGHINDLYTQSASFANIKISGVADTVEDLPQSGAVLGDVWAVPGDPHELYAFNGSVWVELEVALPVLATTEKAGTVVLGTLSDALGANPSPTKVIAETVLDAYAEIGSAGVLVNSIAIWRGTKDTVPTGWVVCDGENGTPDLRGKFIRAWDTAAGVGVVAGSDEVAIPASTLPDHTHTIDGVVSTTAHSHSYAFETANAVVTHEHTLNTIDGSTARDGQHTHGVSPSGLVLGQSPSQFYCDSYVYDPRNYPVGGAAAAYSQYLSTVPAHIHAITTLGDADAVDLTHAHTGAGITGASGSGTVLFEGETSAYQEDIEVAKDNRPKYIEVVYIMKQAVVR